MTIKHRRLGGIAALFGRSDNRGQKSDPPAKLDLRPPDALRFYLSRDTARKALSILLANIKEESPAHHDRIAADLDSGNWSPLTAYVIQMAFFESVRPPVRPLALPPKLCDWLLALPDNCVGYHPEDPCWECGYAYPFSDVAHRGLPREAVSLRSSLDLQAPLQHAPGPAVAAERPRVPASPPSSHMHAFVGEGCHYCGAEIVNHLEWLAPNAKRTLSHFQNAPYRKKREAMHAQWRRELEQAPPLRHGMPQF